MPDSPRSRIFEKWVRRKKTTEGSSSSPYTCLFVECLTSVYRKGEAKPTVTLAVAIRRVTVSWVEAGILLSAEFSIGTGWLYQVILTAMHSRTVLTPRDTSPTVYDRTNLPQPNLFKLVTSLLSSFLLSPSTRPICPLSYLGIRDEGSAIPSTPADIFELFTIFNLWVSVKGYQWQLLGGNSKMDGCHFDTLGALLLEIIWDSSH